MYLAAANEMTQTKLFDTPKLPQVIADYKKYMRVIKQMDNKIKETIADYDPKKIRIGVLGSHSALEIASGAKQEGFETVVVCQNGREKTYALYYRNIFDNFIFLDKFSEITKPENVNN